MGLISKDTAMQIALAYQEIERGEKLMGDVRKAIAARKERWPDDEEDIKDALGYRHRELQIGIPSGSNAHQLVGVSYELAVPVIEAHMAKMRAQLAALSFQAKAELEAETPSSAAMAA
jgi:hypothetical protein